MKKLLTAATLMTCIGFGACAQKLDASKVPATVKATFEKKYPGTSVKWEMEGTKYEAGFKKDGNAMSVLYDAAGVATETETDMKVSELPASVQDYVKQHYPGKKIKEGAKIVKTDGTITYEAEVDNKDVLFDVGGKFIKEVKD